MSTYMITLAAENATPEKAYRSSITDSPFNSKLRIVGL